MSSSTKTVVMLVCALAIFLIIFHLSRISANEARSNISSNETTQAVFAQATNSSLDSENLTPTITRYEIGQISEMLTETTECILPCWLEITPGKTTWEEAIPLLSRLTDKVTFSQYENWDRAQIILTELPPDVASPYLDAYFYIVDSTVEFIAVYGLRSPDFFILEVLDERNIPTEMYVRTFDQVIEQRLFEIYVEYREDGILFQYSGEGLGIEEDLIEGCVKDLASIWLWDSTTKSDAIKAAEKVNLWQDWEEFISLEKSTSLNVIDIYTQPALLTSDALCISTPRYLWNNE